MLDNLLFVVFPYVAVALAVGGTIYRFLTNQFSFTSLSSQFLETDIQFWGSTLWHYGILPTLLIHLGGFVAPKLMFLLHSTPETLYLRNWLEKFLASWRL
jgi:nitrate reductase gamma subunit